MKSFLTCLLVALTLGLVAKDNEIDLQSTITDVVVYQQGAQVERQSRATIPAGTSILRFTELHPGIDPNIVVERKRLNQKSSASFIGSKRKDVREFEITARNAKKEAIAIVVDDQLPLTHNEDIEVERVSLDGAHEDELTGRLSWELTVKPGKSERLTFKYALRYPKNMLLALGR